MPTRTVSAAALDAVRTHAEEAYPEECCGLVFDDRVHRAVNVARSGRRFRPGDADQLLLARSFDTPHPARVLYHSHVDTPIERGAYLSDADVAGATLCDAPLYPALLHLVVSVRDGRAAESALFALQAGRAPRCVERHPGTAAPDGIRDAARRSAETRGPGAPPSPPATR